MNNIIEISGLSKTFRTFSRREGIWGSVKDLVHREYRDLKAVDEISFSVQKGELVGYLGPNGAGKSTSIKMLTGILKPTSGQMHVNGFHPYKDRKAYTRHIGVVFGQRTQLWWDIAVIESFRLLGTIYNVPKKLFEERLSTLNKILELEEVLRTPLRKLSLGQRMRCDIAASLLHNPKVIFLDEPTIGLDAVAKDSIRTFLRKINQDFQTTILLTTHDLQEIEELCKRIIIIDKGKIIYDGSLSAVKHLPGLKREITLEFLGEAPMKELHTTFPHGISFTQESERRVKGVLDPQQLSAVDLLRTVVGNYNIADITIHEPSIEDVVMKIYRDGIQTAKEAKNEHGSSR